MSTKCLIVKIEHKSGDPLFLAETHGYGAAWARYSEAAKIFNSKKSAMLAIVNMQLHGASAINAHSFFVTPAKAEGN